MKFRAALITSMEYGKVCFMNQTSLEERQGKRRRMYSFDILGKITGFTAGNVLIGGLLSPEPVIKAAGVGAAGALLYGSARAYQRAAAEKDSVITGEPMREHRISKLGNFALGSTLNYAGYVALIAGTSAIISLSAPAATVGTIGVAGSLLLFYQGQKYINRSIEPVAAFEGEAPQETSFSERSRDFIHTIGERVTHLVDSFRSPEPQPEV